MKTLTLLLAAVLISSFGLRAETKTFPTITDALNYDGADKSFITKLVISDDISGNDYFPDSGSEWGKIRSLDEWYPSIEALELLTSQDMPEFADVVYKENGVSIIAQYGLFYADEYDTTIHQYVNKSAQWLKSFSAPNIRHIGEMCFAVCDNLRDVNLPKLLETANYAFSYSGIVSIELPELLILTYNSFSNAEKLENIKADKVTEIGSMCFYRCYSLLEVDFPEVTKIYYAAFDMCISMVSVNFPKVTSVGGSAFYGCYRLKTVTMGTGFETEMEIKFGIGAFSFYINKDFDDWYKEYDLEDCDIEGPHLHYTEHIELTLGEYVLPLPNLEKSEWNFRFYDSNTTISYVWKIVNVNGIEEIIKGILVNVYPNPTTKYTTLSFNLEHSCYLEINLFDMAGNKIKNIYNGFAEAELFTKRTNTDDLAKGIYFIKIFIDNYYLIKKIIII